MQKYLLFSMAITFLFASMNSLGHSGGLNAQGCHNNRKTGDYHCHRTPSYQKPKVFPIPKVSSESIESLSSSVPYDRRLYGFKTYHLNVPTGFYTGLVCNIDIDHVVSLKDAHQSGADKWRSDIRVRFANDRFNHVPACSGVNRSKGASTPKNFIKRSNDGRGSEYKIKEKCAYLGIYYKVKMHYGLSFKNNDPSLFIQCGLSIR